MLAGVLKVTWWQQGAQGQFPLHAKLPSRNAVPALAAAQHEGFSLTVPKVKLLVNV